MESTLKKFGLRKNYRVELKVTQHAFYQFLKRNVHQKELSFWTFFSERYIKTDKRYIGTCSASKFEIKKRTKFMDSHQNHTIATGKYYEKGESVHIEISLGLLPGFVQFYLLSALLGIFTILLLAPRIFEGPEFKFIIFVFPLFFIFAVFLNIFVYRRKLRDFEKDFNGFLESVSGNLSR